VNDNYGHAAGDAVLREVANRLAKSVRSYDAVSRYGGEEFLLVLRGCGAGLGAERAEHIRRVIDSQPMRTGSGSLQVSMSLGVAGTDHWPGLRAEMLIHEADIALYRAKETGRNRVVLAKPDGMKEIQTGVLKQVSVSVR
jgi:diguanylate cyclase (GGDEF)-like protein